MRRLFLFCALSSALIPNAMAQTGVTCTAFIANQPTLRQEDIAEAAGDILISCSGTLVGAQTGAQTVILYVNGVTITSRELFSGIAPPNNIPTEAALLVNDCTSNSGVSPNGSGFNCAPSGTFTGGTPTQGLLQAGALTFPGFTLPANGQAFQLRITNVRVNATQVAPGSFITGTVLATFGLQYQPNLVLGAVQSSLGVTVSTAIPVLSQCQPQTTTIANLNIQELVNTAFKSPASLAINSTPGQWYQFGINSESQTVLSPTPPGWTNQRAGEVPGQADVATRIRVNVVNIPAGLTVTFPVTVSDGVGGTLVANANGDLGPFSAASGTGVPITSPSGSVTYEVRAQNPSAIDSFTIPLTVSTSGSGGAGTVLVSATYAATTADSFTVIPLFADTSVYTPLLNVISCLAPTSLAFPIQPTNGKQGVALPTFTVATVDTQGDIAPSGALVTVTSTPAGVSTTANSPNGVATFNGLVFNTPGTYTLTATSPGLASATSHAFTINGPATVSLASSLNPSRYGQGVTLTATMSTSAATGIVTFYDGTTILGTEPLVNGKAALTTVLLASGTRSISARYVGSSSYSAAVSPVMGQIVTALPADGFLPAVNYAAGSGPMAAAVADVNGDGIPDVIVVNNGGNSVSVLLGNANGTLQPAMNTPVGVAPVAVAVGDLNGDGKPDLAVVNYNDGTLTVLFGKGDGTFPTVTTFPSGSNPTAVVIADFNGDGIPDLAVANALSFTYNVRLFLGSGDGSFLVAVGYAAGNTPSGMAVGDFNDDGNADLAVTNADGNNVSVLLGNGDGTLQNAVDYATGVGPQSVVVGDFNGDGNVDLAVANLFGGVSVLLGNGNGTFSAPTAYAAGASPYSIVTGDFNGDGKIDLAVANGASGNVSVLLGRGNGAFATASNFATGAGPIAVVAADFNGDGRTDLATADSASNSVSVLLAGNVDQLAFTSVPTVWVPEVALPPVVVQVQNSAGQVDTTSSVAVTVSSSPSGVSATVNAVNGVATFNGLVFAAGNYTLTASSPGLISGTVPVFIGAGDVLVSGQVNVGGVGLSGVTINVNGFGTTTSTVTGSSGSYYVVLPIFNTTYTVSAALAGYSFNGPFSFTNPGTTETVNFTGIAETGLDFYAITPCRVADTRAGAGFSGQFGPPSMVGGVTRTFTVPASACGVPATAAAYSLNFTVLPPAGGPAANLTTWPTGLASGMPNVSTLNYSSSVAANAAIVPAGTNGAINVFVNQPTDVLFDINGYFASPGTSGLEFVPITPCRIADTRSGAGFSGQFGPPALIAGNTRTFTLPSSSCGIPLTASAYSLNFTAVPPTGGPAANLTTWPAGIAMPNASTLNYSGSVVANAAIVPAGANGTIDVFANDPTNMLFDVNGYFAPGSSGWHFYPVTPCRVADTRAAAGFTGQFGPPSMTGGTTRTFTVAASSCGIPATATAYSLNFTVIPSAGGPAANLTTWPTGLATGMPNVSTLNYAGSVVANAAIVPAGTNGAINVFVNFTTDVLFDINGYFAQ